jgi:hypothetical protein
MFVRFRERKSDGREPIINNPGSIGYVELACAGRCADRRGQRVGPGFRVGKGCPMKPRCRWRIKGLVPYRLLVALIENRRIDGKVRQEHIADLGSIAGHLLPGFYPDGPPADDRWHYASLLERHEYWLKVDELMLRLANRVSAEAVELIVARIEDRIPRPTGGDDQRMFDLIQWKQAARGAQHFYRCANREIERHERTLVKTQRELVEARKSADALSTEMVKAQIEVLNLLSLHKQ